MRMNRENGDRAAARGGQDSLSRRCSSVKVGIPTLGTEKTSDDLTVSAIARKSRHWKRRRIFMSLLIYCLYLNLLVSFVTAESSSSPAPPVKADHQKILQSQKRRKQKASTSSSSSSRATITPRRLSLLRIQREWKDAIQAGIAFDWSKGEPVRSRKHTAAANSTNATTAAASSSSSYSHIWIGPLDDRYGLFIWHFTVTGLSGSVFSHGVYHGRVVLPADYPATPPRVQMLTPSGRFVPGADICLSASQYHPETWQPNAWSVRTLVESLRLHMCSSGMLEIGGMAESYEQRLRHAVKSRHWARQISPGVFVDHGRMLEKGYLRPETSKEEAILKEQEAGREQASRGHGKTAAEDAESNPILAKPNSSNETKLEILRDVTKPTKKKPKHRKGKKTKKRTASIQHHPGQVTTYDESIIANIVREIFASPIRIGLLAFFLLFCFLNASG